MVRALFIVGTITAAVLLWRERIAAPIVAKSAGGGNLLPSQPQTIVADALYWMKGHVYAR